ncbi:MAG: DNA translocase FtsK [Alkalispirochaetaceae bacterium]
MEDRSYLYILGGTFIVVAFLLFASILIHLFNLASIPFYLLVLEIPGGFLYRSFEGASLFVPFYLAASALLLMGTGEGRGYYRLLNALILPFFTLALLLRLHDLDPRESAPILRVLIDTLTLPGALGFAAFLLAAEAVIGIRYHRLILGSAPPASDTREERTFPEGEARPSERRFLLEDLRGGETPDGSARLEEVSGDRDGEDEEAKGEESRGSGAEEPGERGPLTVDELRRRLGRYDEEELLEEEESAVSGAVLEVEIEEVSIEDLDPFGDPEDLEPFGDPPEDGAKEGAKDNEGSTFVFSNGRIRQAREADTELEEEQEEEFLEITGDLDLWSADDDEYRDDGALEPVEDLEEPQEPGAAEPPVRQEPRPGASRRYQVPVEGLLNKYDDTPYWELDEETKLAAEVLRVTLEEFNIQAEVTGIRKGPVITMFEILPAPGVKLAKITNLSDNIALRLAASSVRIVAPIPGKHAVGIEIPNKRRNIVSFGELIMEEQFNADRYSIPVALGKDIPGDAQIVDLTKTPHLLIAGATGSGKSVCVNSIICSILYRRTPQEVKMILIDPKIVELKFYNDIPHLLTPVITDPKKAFQALQYCLYEMERRYSLLDSLQVRDIAGYNEKIERRNLAAESLPYIVVLIDEFADLMATTGKELESTVARLAAMSRAVGIHIVLATQRPSTDVITGLIKANIPSRIAFMVASKVDSRIIIDAIGAEKLLGKGDMLFTSAWDPFPLRMQGAFLSEEEVERVVEHVKTLGEPDYIDDEIFIEDEDESFGQEDLEDPLMEQAIEIVQSANKASASYLQRRLKIGYNRAARLVEEMERIGIVGPQNGSKPREIIPR